MLFDAPVLSATDEQVIDDIDTFRRELRHVLSAPRRWRGQLRRNLRARAMRGSNSIEGYDVSLSDAVALLADDETLDSDRRSVAEVMGYRNAMTYIVEVSDDEGFALDQTLLRSLHFMMLGHDLSKSPGRYRRGEIFVHDEEADRVVYEGPDAGLVPGLMAELVERLAHDDADPDECPVLVRAAMAHLNLVMVHPFRDGNGRMARSLQTLVLARDRIVQPEFSSIEEWLGRHTTSYYDVLAGTAQGRWNPGRDTSEWVRFNLRAHHLQAQTVRSRLDEAGRLWGTLTDLAAARGLPDRVVAALFDAAMGLRVRRTVYENDADVQPATATRDLGLAVRAGLLDARGQTRGRFYVRTPQLGDVYSDTRRSRPRLVDPYDVTTGG